MKKLSLIVAIGKNNELGYKNQLLWNLPNDLKYFKEKTQNKVIIMGRKTFEALPKRLPNRKHIIITRNKNYKKDGILVFDNKEAVLNYLVKTNEEAFIIGGGEIYKEFLPYCQTLYITELEQTFSKADCYFPYFDKTKYLKTIIKEELTEKITYRFVKYEKLD